MPTICRQWRQRVSFRRSRNRLISLQSCWRSATTLLLTSLLCYLLTGIYLSFFSNDGYSRVHGHLRNSYQSQREDGGGLVSPTTPVSTTLTTTPRPPEDGYSLATQVWRRCGTGPHNNTVTITTRWTKERHMMDCPTYKIATTFWRRVFYIQREDSASHLHNPFLIPFDKEYPGEKITTDKYNISKPMKFMFTRNPFSRIYSAYVDKLLAPNPMFWRSIGVPAIRLLRNELNKKQSVCGHSLTFPEFVKYVIHTMVSGKGIDPHFVDVTANCRPCDVHYDFIGKMESFSRDSVEMIRQMHLPKMASLLEANGSALAADDAILDTVSEAFRFRRSYLPCLGFNDALQRSWKKLQMRGLVSNQTLQLDNRNALEQHEVTRLARVSRADTDKAVLKKLKRDFYIQTWDLVPLSDLQKIREIYADDFKLFGYDDCPSDLFKEGCK